LVWRRTVVAATEDHGYRRGRLGARGATAEGVVLMTEMDRRARIAGGLYVLSVVPGVFSLRYVPDAIVVRGDPTATIARIHQFEALFRAGVVGELVGAVLWVFVVRALYRLLADVDRGQAWLMAVLGLMAVPILFMNVLGELAVLTMLGDVHFGAAFSAPQLQALVALAMRAHSQGFTLAAVFWGMWLIPFGVLVWRSRFLPRVLGVLLWIAALGYLVPCVVALLAPSSLPFLDPYESIVTAGELPVMFWLLFMGARWRGGGPAAVGATSVAGV
jgi:Domain of unknown function (DUF4386)